MIKKFKRIGDNPAVFAKKALFIGVFGFAD